MIVLGNQTMKGKTHEVKEMILFFSLYIIILIIFITLRLIEKICIWGSLQEKKRNCLRQFSLAANFSGVFLSISKGKMIVWIQMAFLSEHHRNRFGRRSDISRRQSLFIEWWPLSLLPDMLQSNPSGYWDQYQLYPKMVQFSLENG